jgi:hypothetical protein
MFHSDRNKRREMDTLSTWYLHIYPNYNSERLYICQCLQLKKKQTNKQKNRYQVMNSKNSLLPNYVTPNSSKHMDFTVLPKILLLTAQCTF